MRVATRSIALQFRPSDTYPVDSLSSSTIYLLPFDNLFDMLIILYFVSAISQPLSPTVETSNALVHPNGDTTIDFALTIKLSCSMPACLFPADKHTCATTFNSISYDRNILLLQFNQKIVAEYSAFEKLESGLWKITRNPFREVPLITSSGLGYGKSSALSSSLTFTRKPG